MIGERLGVAVLEQNAGFSIGHRVLQTRDVTGQNRSAAGIGLDIGQAQPSFREGQTATQAP